MSHERKPDDLGHKHDDPSHRQGEGHNPAGDEAINRRRVAVEAEKHRDPNQDPADKAEAEQRHDSPKDRVLAAEYPGQDEIDPKAVTDAQRAAEERIAREQDEAARKQAAERQPKR